MWMVLGRPCCVVAQSSEEEEVVVGGRCRDLKAVGWSELRILSDTQSQVELSDARRCKKHTHYSLSAHTI